MVMFDNSAATIAELLALCSIARSAVKLNPPTVMLTPDPVIWRFLSLLPLVVLMEKPKVPLNVALLAVNIADADTAVNNINAAALSLEKLSNTTNDLVAGDGKKTFQEANATLVEIKGAAADARALVAKLQGPTSDFATNGLPQLTAAVGSLQQTAESLRRLSDEIQQDPRALLTKAPAKEVQVKP